MRAPYWWALGIMGALIAAGVVLRLIFVPVENHIPAFWWGVIIGGAVLLLGGVAQGIQQSKIRRDIARLREASERRPPN